ncbi:methyltransferase domain-containing protein [Flavivirga amylovorans]|uniref:Methyltransferase domain-containing protein n=1 Tax=Flavivirga amylovorans TaxID=870486 RepID=A0ABT8WZF8_9FLAO|nr:methyltransferase domain-containing protein [Flavivirga amylovorans]MDO5986740.1 methyltransferase domain-containing protein [Flavivirga amylovorans]
MQKNNQKELETYWSKRYIDESTGWDLGRVSDPIRCYIDQLKNKDIKILVPGAGNAYEAEYLYKSGFNNTYIIDISELPLKNFKDRVPDFPDNQILHGDFFNLDDTFDLIIEQTFMCSFPPIDNNREMYAKKMHELLKPKGKLVGLWFNMPLSGDNFTNRPFGGTKQEYSSLFSKYFEAKTFEEAYNSVSDRAGQELFGVFEKK